jgi:uncharacterized protein (DUF3820 family)
MSEQKPVCNFGLYKGEPYTKLPVTFLNWMVTSDHPNADIALNELNRRSEAVDVSNQCRT